MILKKWKIWVMFLAAFCLFEFSAEAQVRVLFDSPFGSSFPAEGVFLKYPFLSHNPGKISFPSLHTVFGESRIKSFRQPSIYSFDDLAFFCKVEVKIEQATKIPFKFRLGDVQHVDYLERKTNFPR